MYKKFTIICSFDLFFYNLEIESSQSFKIVLNDRNIIFYTNQVDNIGKKYRNFARKNMQEYFEKVIEKLNLRLVEQARKVSGSRELSDTRIIKDKFKEAFI